MFSENDKIRMKFFIKYILKLKEPIPHSESFNGMAQRYIMGRRCNSI